MRAKLQLACLAAAAAASLATSAPRGFRSYPAWRPHQVNHVVGGSVVGVWAARSGREGVGIVVQVRQAYQPGAGEGMLVVDSASTVLELGRRRIRPGRVVPGPSPGGASRTYLVFRFDGLGSWNAGERSARLRLALVVGGAPRELLVDLGQSRLSAHGTRTDPSVAR
ncbi:MAG: hypothetical protein HYY06_25330 [Deltaproteobacteria bacterium]|nr:hypothetical protein [Deltaproteobacteria bacterium]